jgi:hypothetical protein
MFKSVPEEQQWAQVKAAVQAGQVASTGINAATGNPLHSIPSQL